MLGGSQMTLSVVRMRGVGGRDFREVEVYSGKKRNESTLKGYKS